MSSALARAACGLAVVTAAAALDGCGGIGRRGTIAQGLQNENPSVRSASCVRAARARDRESVPLLVERLEDTSADVRMLAIKSLEKIVGTTRGYRYYDPPSKRAKAVAKWRRWLATRTGTGKGG